MQYGIFVCSKCAGIHRELNTKVKGIGVCNFDDKEIALLNKMGNDVYKQLNIIFSFNNLINFED